MIGKVATLDEAAVRSDIALLHELAARANVKGKLVLASFGQDPQSGIALIPAAGSFPIGDVETMVIQALRLAREAHRNIYMPLAIMREDLPSGRKGTEDDVVAVLGIVAD